MAERVRIAARRRGRAPTLAACARWVARYAAGLPRTRSGRAGSFTFRGQAYDVLAHRHNHTWLNERGVEVPLVRRLVDERPGARVLEVGNVLRHYHRYDHEVLDRYEIAPGVINEDVLTFAPSAPYELIVSISTLEHVGWDEEPREPARAVAAVERLRRMLAPGGTLVATIPAGYNPALDAAIFESRAGFDEVGALRRGGGRRWREVDPSELRDAPYDELLYEAGGVFVGTASGAPA